MMTMRLLAVMHIYTSSHCIVVGCFFVLQLLFSLHHYDGDDRIKDFIFDLVSSTVDGQEKDYRNHTGTVCRTSSWMLSVVF